jgi:hypothetical protein
MTSENPGMNSASLTMNAVNLPSSRRHDLDALRAVAMLLGIFYHVALSFALGFGWMVQDVSQGKGPYLFQAFVHGFRMPLFMLVSGFFTAMLWRKQGLRALLWHRFRRVLLPCLLGLFTVVPAMIWSSSFGVQSGVAQRQKAALAQPASNDLWAAIRKGDAEAVQAHLQQGVAPGALHTLYGVTPLTWAALTGQGGAAAVLLERGAQVNGRNRDGGTALHAAAFLGRADIVDLLIRKGADVNATNYSGEVPLGSASVDWGIVQYIAGILAIPVEKTQVETGRGRTLKLLHDAGAKAGAVAAAGQRGDGRVARPSRLKAVLNWLTDTPVFILIWFLWILWWLVVAFAAAAAVAQRIGWKPRSRFIPSSVHLAWLVPLTMIPIWFMDSALGSFGPDISMGILPIPRVFGYYAIFFFFGAVYYDCDDAAGRLGRSWRWTLPLTLLVIFPVGLEIATGYFGLRDAWLPARHHRLASVAFQALYGWMMSFGCIGMFRSLLTRENKTIRYLSDSAYWLYLAHLPLVIVAQAFISNWPLPAWIKLTLLSVVLTGFLLLTYDKLVRYTWVGRLLNGPRARPEKQVTLNTAPEGANG